MNKLRWKNFEILMIIDISICIMVIRGYKI